MPHYKHADGRSRVNIGRSFIRKERHHGMVSKAEDISQNWTVSELWRFDSKHRTKECNLKILE